MSTIQVDEETKKMLFKIAAELQQRSGSKVSLSEAIRHLLETYRKSQIDREKILSLFGCLRGEDGTARTLLRNLRQGEERKFEALTGEPYSRHKRAN